MEKIIFSKYSSERSRDFAIRTDILQNENKVRTVEKHPLYPEGVKHVQAIQRWYELLKKEYEKSGLAVNHCEQIPDGVRLEYLVGETLQERILTLAKQKRETEILAYVEKYLDRLTKGDLQPFVKTEQFVMVFGEVNLPEDVKCLPVTNIDMIFSNILLTGDTWSFIDYEWTFDFPVPLNFVLYRAFFLASHEIPEASCIHFDKMMDKLGIGYREYQEYARMEEHFQQYVRGSKTPVRDIMTEIGYRVIPMKEVDEQMRRQAFPRVRAAFAKEESGEPGNFIEAEPESLAGEGALVCVAVPEDADHMVLMIDAGSALIQIKQMLTDKKLQSVEGLSVNGMELGTGMYLVMADAIQFILPCKGCREIELSFVIQRLMPEINRKLIGNLNRILEQKTDLAREAIRLQGENEDFKNSKVYKLYKLRRRNK